MKDYKTFIDNTMKTLVKDQKITVSEIMCTAMESLMEAERTMFLEYEHGQRTSKSFLGTDNKRNGYYQSFVSSLSGKMDIRVPRDRKGIFTPLTLELIKQDSDRMNELSLLLYSKGLSTRSIEKVMKDIFKTNYSPQRVSSLVKEFQKVREKWQLGKIDSQYHAIVLDAVHINIRRDTVEKEAIYIAIGLKEDFSREILGIYNIPQESALGWEEVMEDLRKRGLEKVSLFLCDECSGIEKAISKSFPGSMIQFCIVHKARNIGKVVRASLKKQIMEEFKNVFDLNEISSSEEKVLSRLESFVVRWEKQYPKIRNMFPERKLDKFAKYTHFPFTVRRMFYTTNWIERLNKEIRKVTRHTNSFPNPDSAMNLVFMVAMDMEKRTYSRPIANFFSVKEEMNRILNNPHDL